MKYKLETSVGPLHPSLLHALDVVDFVWRKFLNRHPVCTGLAEPGHSERSRHYGLKGDVRCRAADFRIRDLNESEILLVDKELRKRLSVPHEYDMVWEELHLHIEVDRK